MFKRHRTDVVGRFTAGGVLVATAIVTAFSGSAATGTMKAPAPAYEAAVEGTGLQCAEVDSPQDDVLRPTTAVIRTGADEVQVVPFTRGRDVHTGQVSGSLLAVCSPDSATAAGFDPID